jgi:hypothetical protein
MSTSGNTGPPGRPRGIGFGILMFIVTLHLYSWYWVFKTQVSAHTAAQARKDRQWTSA